MLAIDVCPLGVEMLSQNDFFTKAILGPVKKPELGVPLAIEKNNVAYAYGITRLKRRDWLKDPIRSEIAEQLDVPAEFISLDDRVAHLTQTTAKSWSIGFWLAGATLLLGGVVAMVLRP